MIFIIVVVIVYVAVAVVVGVVVVVVDDIAFDMILSGCFPVTLGW